MLPAAEGAFVSDFLVSGSGKGSWWEQKRLTHDGERIERMEMCSCGLGRKRWRLRGCSPWAFTWWRNRNPYTALGLFNIPNKILTAKGLCMGQLWVNSLGISVFSFNTYILLLAMMLLWPQWSEDIRKMRFPVAPSWEKYEWRCFSFLLGNYLEGEHLYLRWCSGFSGRLYKLSLKIHII